MALHFMIRVFFVSIGLLICIAFHIWGDEAATNKAALFTFSARSSVEDSVLSAEKSASQVTKPNIAVEKKLEHLSNLEREYLENFFQYTMRISTFGYVLFGDKPMSIDAYDNFIPQKSVEGIDYMADEHILDRYRLKEGWEVWIKILPLFPLPNHTFISYVQPEDSESMEICVINNRAFIDTVNKNLQDFHNVLNTKATAQEIFEDYIHQGPSFAVIRGHDGLFGTLLGFGRTNAWTYFESNDEAKRAMVKYSRENLDEVKLVILPLFAAKAENPENDILEKKYMHQRALFEPKFSRGNYAIVAITRLLAPND
jgi:hypothetical protein